MNTFRAAPACGQIHILGEGPVWDAVQQRLIWVDINAGAVHTGVLDGDQVIPQQRLDLAGTIGAAVCSEAGDLLVAGSRALELIRGDGTRTVGPQIIPDHVNSRLNDGGCDPAGRFLVGTLALDDRHGEEQLVRIDEGAITVIDDDLGLSNGLAWSPGGELLYSIDTTPGLIHVRTYDPATGVTGDRKTLLQITNGHPDGMCTDTQGNLWVAIWGAGQIRCFSADGVQLATVEVAAPNTSSVAFAGDDLSTLVITTASEQLSAEQLARFPDSGKLFSCRVGVTGLPAPYWSGP